MEWVGEAHHLFNAEVSIVKHDPFLFYLYTIDNYLTLSKLDESNSMGRAFEYRKQAKFARWIEWLNNSPRLVTHCARGQARRS